MDPRKLLTGAVVATAALIGGLLISKKVLAPNTLLTVAAGSGGTTDPAPGVYTHRPTDVVQVKAIPDGGYHVLSWIVDGVTKGSGESIFISMNESHNVAVAFTTELPPPIRFPFKIVNLTAPPPIALSLKQKYAGYFYWAGSMGQFRVNPIIGDYGVDWEPRYTEQVVEFQVLDVSNQPCPNIKVLIYTSNPDASDGVLFIGEGRYHVNTPLVAFSGNDGKVQVRLSYRHIDLSAFSRNHCCNKRAYYGGLYYSILCLSIGRTVDPCNFAINGCTSEWNLTVLQCDETRLSQVEVTVFETTPIQNIVYAEYAENRSVFGYGALVCWFGIKNVA